MAVQNLMFDLLMEPNKSWGILKIGRPIQVPSNFSEILS
jgi:hypothetical protein